MTRFLLRIMALAIAILLTSDMSSAQEQSFEYGIPFRAIRAADNAAYDGPGLTRGLGAVAYEFRLSETEVTVSDWRAFVTAFAPYWDGQPESPGLVGQWIRFENGVYVAVAGSEQFATNMSWRMAARYCNWLHNDRGTQRAAFQSGAYDVATFEPAAGVPGEITPFSDQLEHSPGARFWIPTASEWIKGAFYDPEHGGPNLGGYWLHPNASDRALQPGLPSDGGATNAGTFMDMPVGSYAQARSPWGLLDVSGGLTEWAQDAGTDRDIRLAFGTRVGGSLPEMYDRLDVMGGDGLAPFDSLAPYGLRIAAVIPSPSSMLVLAPFAIKVSRRKART